MKDRRRAVRAAVTLATPFFTYPYFFLRKPSDLAAIGISAVALALSTKWLVADDKALPKWLQPWAFVLAAAIGLPIAVTTLDRYQSLSFGVGIAASLVPAAIATIVAWRRTNALATSWDEDDPWDRIKIVVRTGVTGALIGGLLLLPLLVLLNAQGDAGPPSVEVGMISDKSEGRTERGGALYRIVLTGPAADYGWRDRKGEFSVSDEDYRAAQIGARWCMRIHTGLLRFRWFALKPC